MNKLFTSKDAVSLCKKAKIRTDKAHERKKKQIVKQQKAFKKKVFSKIKETSNMGGYCIRIYEDFDIITHSYLSNDLKPYLESLGFKCEIDTSRYLHTSYLEISWEE